MCTCKLYTVNNRVKFLSELFKVRKGDHVSAMADFVRIVDSENSTSLAYGEIYRPIGPR